jgi:hypothetical protein
MGPFEGIRSICRNNYGPIRIHRQLLLQMQWAHPRALATAARTLMGPCEAIGNILLEYDSGPTRSIRPLYLMGPLVKIAHFCLMGPCGLSRVHRSNCTWVLSTATTNICYIMWGFMCLNRIDWNCTLFETYYEKRSFGNLFQLSTSTTFWSSISRCFGSTQLTMPRPYASQSEATRLL